MNIRIQPLTPEQQAKWLLYGIAVIAAVSMGIITAAALAVSGMEHRHFYLLLWGCGIGAAAYGILDGPLYRSFRLHRKLRVYYQFVAWRRGRGPFPQRPY
ncbi:hypothetical protein HY491_02395 [Candidatus Woesearchaeota archaeon]|nr:hypothetical protein [Candidatus Woesearchaeota archaeon]